MQRHLLWKMGLEKQLSPSAPSLPSSKGTEALSSEWTEYLLGTERNIMSVEPWVCEGMEYKAKWQSWLRSNMKKALGQSHIRSVLWIRFCPTQPCPFAWILPVTISVTTAKLNGWDRSYIVHKPKIFTISPLMTRFARLCLKSHFKCEHFRVDKMETIINFKHQRGPIQ